LPLDPTAIFYGTLSLSTFPWSFFFFLPALPFILSLYLRFSKKNKEAIQGKNKNNNNQSNAISLTS
jgi:hypothetical protein